MPGSVDPGGFAQGIGDRHHILLQKEHPINAEGTDQDQAEMGVEQIKPPEYHELRYDRDLIGYHHHAQIDQKQNVPEFEPYL